MHAPRFQPESGREDGLLDLVAFKWLMTGIGWRVDVPRMRRDADYARACAQLARDSGRPELGRCSEEMMAALVRDAALHDTQAQ